MTDRLDTTAGDDPVHDRIAEARDLLRLLRFDEQRSNERSAQVLLALAALRPEDPWDQSASPLLRTVEIMAWIREHYGTDYKPNTRETIRRETLHQFIDAGLVVYNPDKPDRPVNSPNACYQLQPQAMEVIRAAGSQTVTSILETYLEALPGQLEAYAAAREMNRIPVTLPDGTLVTLSPGGQNVLIREIIEDFCSRFTPGGHVLYLGDADEKWAVFAEDRLKELGVTVDSHGKMPDVVVNMPDKQWLVLMEAASSHGPVDAKRHGELKALFHGCVAGLVFVSCFPTRVELRKYLKNIAWETEVWCADNPTHMIHFNGERFLGPYGDEEHGCGHQAHLHAEA